MTITIKEDGYTTLEHDGLIVAEDNLQQAIISYGEGMKERGRQGK